MRKQVRDAPALHSSAAANGLDGYGSEGEEDGQASLPLSAVTVTRHACSANMR